MQTGENYLRNLPKLVDLWADDIDRLDIRDESEPDGESESPAPRPRETPPGKPGKSERNGESRRLSVGRA
ncbi:hypothetical protein [Methylomagnum sp.]